jgi:transcriptional regulator with XRE-family HTH domain
MEISPAKRVGRILELLRSEAGKTQQEVAKAAHCSNTLVSHLENGNKGAHIDTVTAIGEAIRHKEVVAELWGFVGSPGTDATADLLAGFEAEATRISVWTTTLFHALLQTEDYAHAVIRAALPFTHEGEIDKLLQKRMDRQQSVKRDNPALLWSVIDESILYRPYGGKAVMREQLAHLEELAVNPGIVIQIMPYTAVGHPGLEGSLGVVEFSDKTPIWYSDAWSAGKLSDDRAEVTDYTRYFDLIRAAALSPADSIALIREVRESKYAVGMA